MTNYEWLLNMGGEERQAWFDAEHVDANDTLSAVNDVSADAADANDANVAQDSREKLEADIWAGCEHLTTAKRHALVNVHWRDLLGWLDRQAAIMRLECAEEYRTRLSELHGLLDKAASERELLRAELTEYKHSHPDAPNQLISQYDELKSEEPAGICTAKCDMHDFADSREKLEADVRKHYAYSTTTLLYPPSANKTTDMLRSLPIDTVVGWLDRQAAITAEETSGAWEEYRDATQREIAELTAQVDELEAALAMDSHIRAQQSNCIGDLAKQRDELQRELDIANAKLAGKPECEICDRATLLVEIEKLTAERDAMKVKLDDAVADRDYFIELFREQEARAEKYAKERDNLAADLDDAMRRLAPKAKDGEPIAIGETLYGEDCKAWEVEGFDFSKAPYTVVGVHREAGCGKQKRELKPKWLTHEEPDSWVRIIEDAIRGDGGSYGCLQERFEATVPGLVERCGKLANRRVTT